MRVSSVAAGMTATLGVVLRVCTLGRSRLFFGGPLQPVDHFEQAFRIGLRGNTDPAFVDPEDPKGKEDQVDRRGRDGYRRHFGNAVPEDCCRSCDMRRHRQG